MWESLNRYWLINLIFKYCWWGEKFLVDQGRRKDEQKLPSSNDESRNMISGWGIPKKPAQKADHLDEEGDEGKKH